MDIMTQYRKLIHLGALAVPVMFAALAVLAVGAEPSAAAMHYGGALPFAAAADLGKTTGTFLTQLAGGLLAGIAAIMAIYFLVNRKFTEFGMWFVLLLVCAWIVSSPTAVISLAKGIASKIFG